ncbi:DNA cytosine methyltransferase [Synechococcus sp. CB0101]|uniref:DNA cytosine methyltransferase n=1 Tax=Synechococcus sp. CB0101 TaxID=232348 RepID=UPI000200312B|nr:DNA cytosine methyltransferase [Synechococcus sp. CB0101]QCH15220.1 DNA cytosine methyltransferase [Synechococcus sp. CB0101]
MAHLTCIESFSGPGGMSLGLERAGFQLLYAFDNDAPSVVTHNLNLNGKCFQLDARQVDSVELLAQCGLSVGDLDLFSGGPPCQGFSKQRRGAHLGDDRNLLVLEYLRLVQELKPKSFLFENVAIFGQKRGLAFLAAMKEALSAYRLYPNFFNSADFGLAQTRHRFMLVGIRRDIGFRFLSPPPTVQKWATVRDVIGDMPPPPSDCSEHPDFFNHAQTKITKRNIERFSYVPQGGGWQDIPWDLRLDCHKTADIKSGGWPDVYGRLSWDGQCPTITGGFDSFTRGRYGHPEQNRALTPREAARLQGFPDNFILTGNRHQVRHQIGNVVPPPLAEAVGKQIADCLNGKSQPVMPDFEQLPLAA